MLKLRTDTAYVAPTGKLIQAGYEALQGQFDGQAAVAAGLDTRLTTVETATSFVRLQTAVAASSQTEINFTNVPAWVNRITVMFNGLSTNGTSAVLIQIGDSGGVETTGYTATNLSTAAGAVAHGTSTAGYLIAPQAATDTYSGAVTILKCEGTTWVASGHVKRNSSALGFVDGDKALSGVLDRVRVTMANGTDTFDAGSVNISWE